MIEREQPEFSPAGPVVIDHTQATALALSSAEIGEADISRYLYDPDAPDPDLLIRTGGDLRVSNFLLWQISYTELWVTPVKWPEFKKEHLHEAIREFSKRDRRFGNINDQA